MGFQDALYKLRLPYASEGAVEFADTSMELIAYHALLASAELAKERGAYSTFKGSKWGQGLLPLDTIELLAQERGGLVDMDRKARLDWSTRRAPVAAAPRGTAAASRPAHRSSPATASRYWRR